MTDEAQWTIRRVVRFCTDDFAQKGLPSPRLDAELVVAHALGLDRVRLYMDLDRPLSKDELAKVRELIVRRRKREPIAYILGSREFYGRRFQVSPAVLVPRPDTETLIERALAIVGEESNARVLDLCTGSGCIAITLAAERAGIAVDATDLSAAALAVARTNAGALGVAERVSFHEGDLFGAVPADARCALVVSNPPYLAQSELAGLDADVRAYEPHMALSAGSDALAFYRRIASEVSRWLEPGGTVLVEVGAGQAPEVERLFAAAGLLDVRTHADLGGHGRVVEGRAP